MKIKITTKKGLTRKLFGQIGLLIFVLFIALTACFTFYRLRGLTAEERIALATMNKDYRPPAHGVNAFPLLFYMRYDVPNDQLSAQMAIDIKKVSERLNKAIINTSDELNNQHKSTTRIINGRQHFYIADPWGYMLGGSHLPALSEHEADVLCHVGDKGCLTKVAANRDAVSAALAAHPVIGARAQALEDTDFYWEEFPADFRSPSEHASDAPMLWLSAFALKYIQGDRTGALAATCRNIAAWRRITHGSNSLFGEIFASARMDGAIRLYADMLAGLPIGSAVPDDCALALQPVVATDVERCAVLARQYSIFESSDILGKEKILESSKTMRLYAGMLLDSRKTAAWTAQLLAASCGDGATALFLADERPSRQPVHSFLGIPFTKGLACIANIRGCGFIAGDTPIYEAYDSRILDQAAHLRLAATLLWLREHPGGSVDARFEQRPAQLRSPHHHSWYDSRDGILYVENFDQTHARGKQFGLPVTAILNNQIF